jgi:hypothetical protein
MESDWGSTTASSAAASNITVVGVCLRSRSSPRSKGQSVRFKRGQKVRCQRGTPPKGTWKRYDGKTGHVRVARNDAGEVGVWLGNYTPEGNEMITWFLPTELVPL